MKLKLSILTFLIGVVGIILSFNIRESYEKEMYEVYLQEQKESLLKGWSESWKEFIFLQVKKGRNLKGESIFVDRKGKLISPFFPSAKKVDWQEYRGLKGSSSKEKFLKEVFLFNGSWERSLAISEWLKLKKKLPKIALSPYEKSLFNEQAKISFDYIFKQLAKRKDYAIANKETKLEKAFFRESPELSVEVFMPYKSELEKKLLNEFEKEYNLQDLSLGKDIFSIELKTGINPLVSSSNKEKVVLLISLFFILLGVLFYYLDFKRQKKEVLKKVSFLNQLVHEVKTPVTGIRLNSELLLKTGHDPEIMQALLSSSKRLHDFFEDIILINKNDEKVEKEELSETNFNEFLENIGQEFVGKITLRNVVKEPVFIDFRRTRIILRNLLKNAIRYGKKGSLEAYLENKKLYFIVTDEGPGVSLGDQEKIFNEFYRGKEAKDASPDGLGIGLSIVRKISEQMNAEVNLLNPGKKRAKFEFKVDA